MKTLAEVVPLAIGVAVVGALTWFLLGRNWALGRWMLAALLFAHGWVHAMFVFPAPTATSEGRTWPFDLGRSWLITGTGIDPGLVRTIAIVVIGITLVAFLLAALSTVGVLVPAGWWRGLIIGSASGSIVLLVAFFSPTLLLGLAIDAVLVWFATASIWTPNATPGGGIGLV